ncbi:cache domain-containing protein [Massilia sp. DJPM01]|uniref:cache domain-containing protein n=1 Tax=Massilia sp. DJPM01 TaxID=3024404 RepID=UPI00259DFA1B|nr:cache domain-containing protein [Massilia sp. DJPM01]MDM5176622.1 cache domain-containing protein [Massilia sp. DJPM01]
MKIFFKALAMFVLAIGMQAGAAAEEKRTPEEAIAMVKKRVAYYKEVGREKAIAAFNDPKGKFVDGSLYIFAYDMKGINLASPNPKIIGRNMYEVKDQNGVRTVKSYIDVAQQKGSGWVDFVWPHPQTGALQPKSAYIEKVDDILIACGIYK